MQIQFSTLENCFSPLLASGFTFEGVQNDADPPDNTGGGGAADPPPPPPPEEEDEPPQGS